MINIAKKYTISILLFVEAMFLILANKWWINSTNRGNKEVINVIILSNIVYMKIIMD